MEGGSSDCSEMTTKGQRHCLEIYTVMQPAKKSELDNSLLLFPWKSPKRQHFLSRSRSQPSEQDAQMGHRWKQALQAVCCSSCPLKGQAEEGRTNGIGNK